MNAFVSFVERFSPLSPTTKEAFLSCLTLKYYRKGDIIFRPGTLANELHFIKSGLIRVYRLEETYERTLRFIPEYNISVAFESFNRGVASDYTFEALENTEVVSISRKDLYAVCDEYHDMQRAVRIITEEHLMVFISMLEDLMSTAEARYKRFVSKNPDLLNRVTLGQIASYLDIKQETLSRIRAKFQKSVK